MNVLLFITNMCFIENLPRLVYSPSLMISANVVYDALVATEPKFFISLLTLTERISKQASNLWNYPWLVGKVS